MKKGRIPKYLFYILIAGLLFWLNPEELYHTLSKKDSEIRSILSDPTMKSEIINDNSPIKKIYLSEGKTYHISTGKDEYIVKVRTKNHRSYFDIYKLDHSFTHYKN